MSDPVQPPVSVLIPTRDRPGCLERLLQLLLAQTVFPAEVVVVDQSPGDDGRRRAERLFGLAADRRPPIRLHYIHDTTIAGAAVARNRAMAVAHGAIWLFLDDDMEPEADFIEQLLAVYARSPSVGGVSGLITNYSRPSLAFRIWSWLFVRGPFHDERQPIYWSADRLRERDPLPVSRFGSGLMSFRAELIRHLRFDESLRGLPPGEDVDFCLRLGPATSLVIAPRARIAHQPSAVGRSAEYWVKEFVQGNLYVYYRNWRCGVHHRLCRAWLQLGCGLAAALGSLRRRSLGPWRAFVRGVREARYLASPARSFR